MLLRFVISAQLPAGGAASSQMTRVASGIVATTTANWKSYTQKCVCLVILLWVRGSDILVEGGGENCCIKNTSSFIQIILKQQKQMYDNTWMVR